MRTPVRATTLPLPVNRLFFVGRNYHAHAIEMGESVAAIGNHVEEISVNARVVAEFRMKRRRQSFAFANHDRVGALGCDHFNIVANAFDSRGANKNHFNRVVLKLPFPD